MKTRRGKMIELSDFNDKVRKIYGRVYDFQQQDGCKNRGTFDFTVPSKSPDDFENDTVLEKVNGPQRGVSFKAWLARDPKLFLKDDQDGTTQWRIDMWWERNFYPDVQMIANDLCEKGKLKPGDYTIIIDW